MYLVWKLNFFICFSLESELKDIFIKNTIIYISKSNSLKYEIYVVWFGIRTFLAILVWNPNF